MSSFPLHKLPNNAAKLVLMHMEPQEKFAYSFCSKTTKNIVKSLNLTAITIKFEVGMDMAFRVRIDRHTTLLIAIPFDLVRRGHTFRIFVEGCFEDGSSFRRCWLLPKYSRQKVCHHLLEIFHHPKLDEVFFENDELDIEDIESVQRTLDGVKMRSLSLVWQLTEEFRSWALRTFQNYDELYVRNFNSQKDEKILMQNLRRVVNVHAYAMTIDQVLISNSELIQFNSTLFVEKDFNRFLKLWIRGSNPRLKKFHAGGSPLYRHLQAELILKGIKYRQIPSDSEEVHVRKMIGGWEDETELAGGYIIRRFDGDDAVVVIEDERFDFITDCFQSN
ncbi:unnamed protein product [Caenorhabditis brenneri]